VTDERIQVSFEFFPPATEKMERILWASVERLEPLGPRFVPVTYGADGSTRDRTHRIVQRIRNDTGLTCAPHLTCVGSRREEVLAIARKYWDAGIRHMVALRGDPPPQETQPQEDAGHTLDDCELKPLSANLNFRRSPPDGPRIDVIWARYSGWLRASEKRAGYFKVRYYGAEGWVSGDYVQTRGDCGA